MKLDRKKITDYFSGKFSEGNSKYLEELFLDKEKEDDLKEFMAQDWEKSFENDDLPKKDLSHILFKLYENIQKQRNKKGKVIIKIWRAYARLAAMLLIPLGLIYALHFHNQEKVSHNETSMISLNAPLGSRLQFTLPDGSTGWLNSGSTIKYPAQFDDTRDVHLVGEAWFDVKKDVNRPFNVVTSDVNISVLGTKFNVNAYQEKKIDVVLESGKVSLKRKNKDFGLEMLPKERVVIDVDKNKVSRTNVETNKYSGWKDGKLVFRNDTMEDVIKRLSRWYNVSVEVKNETGKDLRLRATFQHEEIEEVLRLLKMTFPIDYTIMSREKDENDQFLKQKIILIVK